MKANKKNNDVVLKNTSCINISSKIVKSFFVSALLLGTITNTHASLTLNETNTIKVTNDIRINMEAIFEKKILLSNMINNYIIKESPLLKVGNRYQINYSSVNIANIMNYYGLDSNFFRNYKKEDCTIAASSFCEISDFQGGTGLQTGLNFSVNEKGIFFYNAFGNELSNLENRVLERVMNKYSDFFKDDIATSLDNNTAVFNKKFDNNVSDFTQKILQFSNFNNYVISTSYVTPYSIDIWIKPDGNGDFIFNKSTKYENDRVWEEFNQINTKAFTITDVKDLKYIRGIKGDQISVKLETNTRIGIMTYVNTGKFANGDYRWSSINQKDIVIDNKIEVINECKDFKRIHYLDDYRNNETTIKNISNYAGTSVVEIETLGNFFRENYKVKQLGDKELNNFNYSDPESYKFMSGIGYVEGVAPKQNVMNLSLFDRVSNTPVRITNLEIVKYELYNLSNRSWRDYSNDLVNKSVSYNNSEIQYKFEFNANGIRELEDNHLYSYGLIKHESKIYNTYNHLNLLSNSPTFNLDYLYYGENTIMNDSMINTVPNLPSKIKYRISFNSNSEDTDSKYILLNNEHGCYIKEVKYNKEVKN